MDRLEARKHWESAAPGWAQWEGTIAAAVEPATEMMLEMAGVGVGTRVLDVACGAGSQTLRAARRVGAGGEVLASDISDAMLRHVAERARAASLANVTTMSAPAETLDVPPGTFDAAICRLGLMLFGAPLEALTAVRRALRPGGMLAVVVFTTAVSNPFMSRSMQILLRHAGKKPPSPGQPGLFALGAPGVLTGLLREGGFVDIATRTVDGMLRVPSVEHALEMMQEAFGAYRAVISDQPERVQQAAWAEVAEYLNTLETPDGLAALLELIVGAGTKPA